MDTPHNETRLKPTGEREEKIKNLDKKNAANLPAGADPSQISLAWAGRAGSDGGRLALTYRLPQTQHSVRAAGERGAGHLGHISTH